MLQPNGYARLNAAIIMSFIMLGSVLLYQYIAYGEANPTLTEDGAEVSSFASVQLFPQTLPLLDNAAYELVVLNGQGAAMTLGRFLVLDQDHIANLNGTAIPNAVFRLPQPVARLGQAEIRLVEKDTSRQPFSLPFISGAFSQDRATMEFFSSDDSRLEGRFMLGTPTDGNKTINERSGVWFGTFQQNVSALRLPVLPQGWAYEGWAVVDGQPLTTGRFRAASSRDLFSAFSGNQAGIPNIPGEDFLLDPPVAIFPNLTFPVDLAGDRIQISVEPDLNGVDPTGQSPFGVVLLEGEVPRRATPGVLYDLTPLSDQQPKATVVLRP